MKELIERLRATTIAAKGWSNVTEIHPATDDEPLVIGALDDGEFYPLVRIDAEDYWQDSMILAKFYAEANPKVVLKLIEEIERLTNEATAWSVTVDNLTAKHEAALTAKSHAVQQAQMWHMEAITQQAIVKDREAERDALKADAERYRWLSAYFVSTDEQHDDSIVACETTEELDARIDVLKGKL